MNSAEDTSERQFLHDLATPLASALFILQNLQEELRAHPEFAAHARSLNELEKALLRVTSLLNDRRNVLRN